MADNNLPPESRVIALAFDGTGYGLDGAIWGGEVLLAGYADFERPYHLEYLPLPGGDAAIRRPWRIAAGYAHALGIHIDDLPFLHGVNPRETDIVRTQVTRGVNTARTSSMGRLFDAVAALTGVRMEIDYEAQGTIELEELSRDFIRESGEYPFRIEGGEMRIRELLAAIVDDVRAGIGAGCIGARFHRTVRSIAVKACQDIRVSRGSNEVVLSGGVWQNHLLLSLTAESLRQAGFAVYTHRRVPTNDGGIALGQAVIAAAKEA
jgi:hydrogenase maturation protein HypF